MRRSAVCGILKLHMRIFVKTKPGARKEEIEKLDDTHYVVSVTEQPIEGRANAAILKLLADHFRVALSDVGIVSGYMSRQKVIEIKKSHGT